jgi:hypothetical protein
MLTTFLIQGFDKNNNSALLRIGCKAMVRLLRRGDHGWYISKFIDQHNHALSETCAEKKQWKSHSELDAVTVSFVRRLKENNISLGRICNIINNGNTRFGSIRRECIRSVCSRMSQDTFRDDLAKTIQLLQDMMYRDAGMSVKFRVDSHGMLTLMIWVTGKNRLDY